MNKVVWGLVVLLIIMHQDIWFWDDRTLVFGFLPIGLAYHAGISLTAAFLWFLATIYCWPDELEEVTPVAASQSESASTAEGGAE